MVIGPALCWRKMFKLFPEQSEFRGLHCPRQRAFGVEARNRTRSYTPNKKRKRRTPPAGAR